MDHGKILSRSWEVTWNNRTFWALGFLAALSSGSGGGGGRGNSFDTTEIEQAFTFDPASGDMPPFIADNPLLSRLAEGDTSAIAAALGLLGVALLAFFLLGIVLWVISHTARVGLIRSFVAHENGEKIAFGSAMRSAFSHILSILGLKIVLYGGVFLLLMLIISFFAALGIVGDSPGIILACFIPLVCVLIIGIIPLSFTDAYAYRGLVLNDMGIIESIRHGWSLFRNNLSDSLILGVLYGVISTVAGFLVLAVVGVFAAFSISPFGEFFRTGEISMVTIVTGGIFALITSIIAAIGLSIFTAWQSNGFTLAYLHMTGATAVPLDEKEPEPFKDEDAFI